MTRKNGLELTTGIVTLVLTAVSSVLFCLSFTTSYYIFGQMQSGIITVLLGGGMAFELAALITRAKLPGAVWPKFLTFVVTGVLAAASMLLLGDRVEGIGNCIITDYDSGHGGEEAIYLSIAASILMLIAMIYNIIGSFARDKSTEEVSSKTAVIARNTGFGVSALAIFLAVIIPTASLVGFGGGGASDKEVAGGNAYTVSFNQNNGNAEGMPNYQFLCCDFSGMVKADSRFFVDVTLNLGGDGSYQLAVDSYVIEAGKRAEVGDDTGLGLVLTMNADGTYTENADGTYTTSVPEHAVFEMQTDTYSAQMKEAAGMAVNGNSEDGVYDSNDEPAVLDFVPETIWTLGSEGDIVTWVNPNDDSADEPDDTQQQEPAGNDAADGLTVTSEDQATTFTFYADGTYRFAFDDYGVEDLGTYTYDGTTLAITNANGDVVTAEGDPLSFHYVTAVSDQLVGDFTVSASDLAALLGGGGQGAADGLTVTSEDGATTFTFNADGTYLFAFEAYGVEDAGTYTYDGTTLTITNANGDVVTAEGDPLSFHYVTAVSDQLVGDFTVSASDLAALLGGGGQSAAGVTVPSEDGATSFTFNADGTYLFAFEAYGVEDAGTYTYDGATLTITNANGDVVTAEGDPLSFHYVTAVSDQLVGDFTVSAADIPQ